MLWKYFQSHQKYLAGLQNFCPLTDNPGWAAGHHTAGTLQEVLYCEQMDYSSDTETTT